MKLPQSASIKFGGIVVVALQLAYSGAALATEPGIAATAYCDANDVLVLEYTSTSWCSYLPGYGCGNENITVRANGVLIGAGQYTLANNWSFSGGPVDAPQPTTLTGGKVGAIVTATAVADWDNTNPGGQSTSIEVPYPDEPCAQPGTGRFTGGGHQIRVDGVRVTRGLTIHCDLLLSNNLEINWNGNQFHMLEHMSTVACTDDPAITQFPPAAPLDTLIGIGAGRYNGNEGYTIHFTLVDYGEPGSDDRMAILITEDATGHVVLEVPLQVLSGGNLQAHFDQPHK